MISDELRFHVVAASEGQPVYFASWTKGEAVWAGFDGRRRFWLLDEAESVIRYLGVGKVVIERLVPKGASFDVSDDHRRAGQHPEF